MITRSVVILGLLALASSATAQTNRLSSADFSFDAPNISFKGEVVDADIQVHCTWTGQPSKKINDYSAGACARHHNNALAQPEGQRTKIGQYVSLVASSAATDMITSLQWFASMGFRKNITFEGLNRIFVQPVLPDASGTFESWQGPEGQGRQGRVEINLGAMITSDGKVANVLLGNTIAHESFHGVQQGYSKLAEGIRATGLKRAQWFEEATANYVGEVFALREYGQDFPIFEHRNYEVPLTDVSEGNSDDGYSTKSFYAALARRMQGNRKSLGLSSLDRAAMDPSYLMRVYEHMDGNARNPNLIDMFDQALKANSPYGAGLHRMYPEVMRDFAYGPDYKWSGDAPNFPFSDRMIKMEYEAKSGFSKEITEPVQILSTRFFMIRSDLLSEESRILIELKAAEGEEVREKDLHLLVEGEHYSFQGGADRNKMILRKTDVPAIVAVANAARPVTATQDTRFTLKWHWLEGGQCSYRDVYGSTSFENQIKAMSKNGTPAAQATEAYRALFPAPGDYLEEYGKRSKAGLVQPDIHPDEAELRISAGPLQMSGKACVHHVGTSTLLEAELTKNAAGLPSGEAQSQEQRSDIITIYRQLKRTMDGEQPTVQAPNKREIASVFRKMRGAFGLDARKGSVMMTVFSPNLYGFWQGHAPYPDEGPEIQGGGGWGPNGAAAVTLMLPGTKVRDLKKGRVYPAVGAIPAMGFGLPLASQWNGSWNLNVGPVGTFDMLTAETLSGFFSVEEIKGGRVIGTFELKGKGFHRRVKKREEVYADEPSLAEDDVSPGATGISVSGKVSAPIVVTGVPLYRNILTQRSVSRLLEGR